MCEVQRHAEEMTREFDVVDARLKTRALLAETAPVLEDLTEQIGRARVLLDRLASVAEEM